MVLKSQPYEIEIFSLITKNIRNLKTFLPIGSMVFNTMSVYHLNPLEYHHRCPNQLQGILTSTLYFSWGIESTVESTPK